MQHDVINSSRLRFLLAICFLACILALGAAGTNDGEVYADGGGWTDTLLKDTGQSMGDPLGTPVLIGSNDAGSESSSTPSTFGEVFVWVSLLLY